MTKKVEQKENELKAVGSKKSFVVTEIMPLLETIADLNTEMYQQIPLPDKQLLLPGFELQTMKEKKQLIDNIHRQLLYKTLLLYIDAKKNFTHPMQLFSSCLAYAINVCEPRSLESQLLLRYISRTSKGMSVNGIFSLESREDTVPSKVLNPWLLFAEMPKDDIVASLLGHNIPSIVGPFGEVIEPKFIQE
jgi:hypothetical protein